MAAADVERVARDKFKVQSAASDQQYVVTWNKPNARWECQCTSFRLRARMSAVGVDCRHTKAVREEQYVGETHVKKALKATERSLRNTR